LEELVIDMALKTGKVFDPAALSTLLLFSGSLLRGLRRARQRVEGEISLMYAPGKEDSQKDNKY
jgi:hypothetical protein